MSYWYNFTLVKTKQRQKKLRTNQKHVSWSEHPLLGLTQPTKYFSNFVIFLPLSITKKIFKHLDRVSILNCLKVSKGWKYLAQEVIDEKWTTTGKENDNDRIRSANVSMFAWYLHQHFHHQCYQNHHLISICLRIPQGMTRKRKRAVSTILTTWSSSQACRWHWFLSRLFIFLND